MFEHPSENRKQWIWLTVGLAVIVLTTGSVAAATVEVGARLLVIIPREIGEKTNQNPFPFAVVVSEK